MGKHNHNKNCKYLGNDAWNCGVIDNEPQAGEKIQSITVIGRRWFDRHAGIGWNWSRLVMKMGATAALCAKCGEPDYRHGRVPCGGFVYPASLRLATGETTEPQPALTEAEKKAAGKKELYAYVWSAMDACNASGLLYSMPKIVDRIREFEGLGGSAINNHPLVVILADKLLQLAGVYHWSRDCHVKVSAAYQAVLEVVQPQPRNHCKLCGQEIPTGGVCYCGCTPVNK